MICQQDGWFQCFVIISTTYLPLWNGRYWQGLYSNFETAFEISPLYVYLVSLADLFSCQPMMGAIDRSWDIMNFVTVHTGSHNIRLRSQGSTLHQYIDKLNRDLTWTSPPSGRCARSDYWTPSIVCPMSTGYLEDLYTCLTGWETTHVRTSVCCSRRNPDWSILTPQRLTGVSSTPTILQSH